MTGRICLAGDVEPRLKNLCWGGGERIFVPSVRLSDSWSRGDDLATEDPIDTKADCTVPDIKVNAVGPFTAGKLGVNKQNALVDLRYSRVSMTKIKSPEKCVGHSASG